jgi:Cu2+-exporting ATPase
MTALLAALPEPACFHCGQAVPADAPRAIVDGQSRPVCCAGCAAAAASPEASTAATPSR